MLAILAWALLAPPSAPAVPPCEYEQLTKLSAGEHGEIVFRASTKVCATLVRASAKDPTTGPDVEPRTRTRFDDLVIVELRAPIVPSTTSTRTERTLLLGPSGSTPVDTALYVDPGLTAKGVRVHGDFFDHAGAGTEQDWISADFLPVGGVARISFADDITGWKHWKSDIPIKVLTGAAGEPPCLAKPKAFCVIAGRTADGKTPTFSASRKVDANSVLRPGVDTISAVFGLAAPLPLRRKLEVAGVPAVKWIRRPLDLSGSATLVCMQTHVVVGLAPQGGRRRYEPARSMSRTEYASCRIRVRPSVAPRSASRDELINRIGPQLLRVRVAVLEDGADSSTENVTYIAVPVIDHSNPASARIAWQNDMSFEIDIGQDLHAVVAKQSKKTAFTRVSIRLENVPKGEEGPLKDAIIHPRFAENMDRVVEVETRVLPSAVWRWSHWVARPAPSEVTTDSGERVLRDPCKLPLYSGTSGKYEQLRARKRGECSRLDYIERSNRDLGGILYASAFANFTAFRYPHSGRGLDRSSQVPGYELAKFEYGLALTFEVWNLSDNEPALPVNPQLQFLLLLPKDFSSKRRAIEDISGAFGLGFRLPVGTKQGSRVTASTNLGVWLELAAPRRAHAGYRVTPALLVGGTLLIGKLGQGR